MVTTMMGAGGVAAQMAEVLTVLLVRSRSSDIFVVECRVDSAKAHGWRGAGIRGAGTSESTMLLG